MAVTASGGSLLSWLIFRHPLLSLIFAAISSLLSPLIVWRIYRLHYRRKLFAQYPDALEMIANQLSAGQSFASSIQRIAKSGHSPLQREFDLIWQQYQLSGLIEEGVALFSSRWPHWATDGFRIALSVCRHTGANMVEMLRTLAAGVRSEAAIGNRIRTLTLQAKIQGCIAIAIPWLIFTGEYLLQPQLIDRALSSPIGKPLFVTAALFDLIGAYLLHRISQQREK